MRGGVLVIAMAIAFDPHLLFLSWSAERQETIATTNRMTCETAMSAIAQGRWLANDPPLAMRCTRGNGFSARSLCIEKFNCEDRR
jgi:hypothetical protein